MNSQSSFHLSLKNKPSSLAWLKSFSRILCYSALKENIMYMYDINKKPPAAVPLSGKLKEGYFLCQDNYEHNIFTGTTEPVNVNDDIKYACKMLDLTSSGKIVREFNAHEDPISHIFYISKDQICTISWDSVLIFWDIRTSTIISSHELPFKVFAADYSAPLLVICGKNEISFINTKQSLKSLAIDSIEIGWETKDTMTSSVALSHDLSNVTLGTIDGKIYQIESDMSENFLDAKQFEKMTLLNSDYVIISFLPHCSNKGTQKLLHRVNDIEYLPSKKNITSKCMLTCGGDGFIRCYDMSRFKLTADFKDLNSDNNNANKYSIGKMKCNREVDLLAYSIYETFKINSECSIEIAKIDLECFEIDYSSLSN